MRTGRCTEIARRGSSPLRSTDARVEDRPPTMTQEQGRPLLPLRIKRKPFSNLAVALPSPMSAPSRGGCAPNQISEEHELRPTAGGRRRPPLLALARPPPEESALQFAPPSGCRREDSKILAEECREPLGGKFGARCEISGSAQSGPCLLGGKTLRPHESLSVVGLLL